LFKNICQTSSRKKLEYKKDFDRWNEKKKIIDQKEISDDHFVNEREIWWGSLGLNVGYEQDGKNENYERPLLVIKKFNRNIVWVIPFNDNSQEKSISLSIKI